MPGEELVDPVERDPVHAVVQIHVIGPFNDQRLRGFSSRLVRILAEIAGVSVLAGDQQDRLRQINSMLAYTGKLKNAMRGLRQAKSSSLRGGFSHARS